MQSGFVKAIDCGKKRDGVHVVFTFFNFCNEFGCGCPAVTNIENSIDSLKSLSNDDLDSFLLVCSSSILDISGGRDLSNEKESNELSTEHEVSKFQKENNVDADNSGCDLPQPSARHRKVEEMLNKRKGKKLTTV